MNLLKSRSLKYGSMSAAFIVIFIALLVILNIVANMLVQRFPLKVDLTQTKAYSISEDTIKFLKTYNKDTEIIFCTERANLTANSQGASAVELVEGYSKRNGKIKVSYINIEKNPAFASNYATEGLSTESVLIRSGEKYRVLSLSSLYTEQTDEYGQSTGKYTSDAENQITGALAYISAAKQIKAAVITNHRESATTGFKALLEKNNYVFADDINLINQDIPADVDIVAIAAPKIDFTDIEINKLVKYLDNNFKLGKNLMIFMDPTQPSLPKFAEFLDQYWGVKADPGIVYDTKQYYQDYSAPVATYAEDEISKRVQKLNLMTWLPGVRPITINSKFSDKSNPSVKAILVGSEDSYYMSNAEGKPDTAKDKKGPFNYMTLSSKITYEGTTELSSNVLVCGSISIIHDNLINQPQVGNGDLMVAIANKMSNIESAITIVPKDLSVPKITLDSNMTPVYLILFIVLIPLIAVVIGVVVFLRRRHL